MGDISSLTLLFVYFTHYKYFKHAKTLSVSHVTYFISLIYKFFVHELKTKFEAINFHKNSSVQLQAIKKPIN